MTNTLLVLKIHDMNCLTISHLFYNRFNVVIASVSLCLCRMTINTKTNVLMLTFESIDWDYSYESDKVVSLVDNNKYPDTPLRQYPYSYIRAQRMAHSGSADTRLINKAEKPRFSRTTSARSTNSMFSKGRTTPHSISCCLV